ncbi:MAG: acetyl-CoA decarbonylase/synthase complex subunit gamma [Planctomycetota bacterium]|jgi:acetyl-CoA decarbonylase/synthase complex subunit gamma
MALTGLDIFKLLPKTNCKKCGMPTCLAFAMQLAQKRAELDACPCVSEEAKDKLAAAAAPPVKLVKFGSGDTEVQVGQETVLFRHEEKFHNPTVLAPTISDSLSDSELTDMIGKVNALQFERVGSHIGAGAVAIVNDSESDETFASVVKKVSLSVKLALILCSESPSAIRVAVAQTASLKPLIASATIENIQEMAAIAKENKCPVVAKAESLEALADLTKKIKSQGVEDIVLSLDSKTLKEQLYSLSRIRVLALKKAFRSLGYPTLSLVLGETSDEQIASAASLICKYSGIVILNTTETYAFLPLLTTVMNIYCDPQKPVQVEPKLYTIGEANSDSPVIFTTNFSLTYYTVEADVEASRVPCYIIVVDTEGTSVLTAYSGDKLNEKAVAEAIKKTDIENIVTHRKLIIPGYVAVMSGKVEEETGWEVLVGPRESTMLPKYLKEVWSGSGD